MDRAYDDWQDWEAMGERMGDRKQEGDRVAARDFHRTGYRDHAGTVIRRLTNHVLVEFDNPLEAGSDQRWLTVDDVTPIAY